jgi:ABC-type sugar transport system ATPase subunit
MTSVVRLRSAVALAGRFPALSGADLTVGAGEVVAVLGPNGSGKTSLLRACAGLLAVVSGEAVVLGCDLVDDRAAVRRQVGLLGHDAPLYDELTAAENVRFAVRASGMGAAPVGPALERLGWSGGWPRRPPDGCRRASGAVPRWPSSSPEPRRCGCSTSPTPGSTPRLEPCSPTWSPRRLPAGRR